MNNKRFSIFASGNGSNAEVLARHALKNNYPLEFVLTDKKDAGVIDRMKALDIKTIVIERNHITKKEHENRIIEELSKNNISWIFLAGFMRILSPEFLENFYDPKGGINRVVNIHPSLLPSFPGRSGYKDAFDYGVKVSGVTVHFVDDGVDSGDIIAQSVFERKNNDEIEDFIRRGLEVEHKLYPIVMDQIMNDTYDLYKRIRR